VARRWRCREGEIDLGELLVFVEVKTRRTLAAAAEAVLPAQFGRIVAAAGRFLAERTGADRLVRFDLALVAAGEIDIVENVSLF
jgi:Holliday junction resolvase-like predicted endonuclease